MSTLPEVFPASGLALAWARNMVALHHYKHSVPIPRTRPLAYVVRVAGEMVGCLWFGRTQSTTCYQGDLTYGDTADLRSGKVCYDRWEVLNLSRVWLSPDVQRGGRLCCEELLPGYIDRRGDWRSALASEVIRLALDCVGYDYLLAHPPVYVDQPYAIRAVLSYCDTTRHRGVIYRAAGFQLARTNDDGIETWYTTTVRPLTPGQDATVRELAATFARSVAIRQSRAKACIPSLFASEVQP